MDTAVTVLDLVFTLAQIDDTTFTGVTCCFCSGVCPGGDRILGGKFLGSSSRIFLTWLHQSGADCDWHRGVFLRQAHRQLKTEIRNHLSDRELVTRCLCLSDVRGSRQPAGKRHPGCTLPLRGPGIETSHPHFLVPCVWALSMPELAVQTEERVPK